MGFAGFLNVINAVYQCFKCCQRGQDLTQHSRPYLTQQDLAGTDLFKDPPMRGLTLVVHDAMNLTRIQDSEGCCGFFAKKCRALRDWCNRALPPKAHVEITFSQKQVGTDGNSQHVLVKAQTAQHSATAQRNSLTWTEFVNLDGSWEVCEHLLKGGSYSDEKYPGLLNLTSDAEPIEITLAVKMSNFMVPQPI